MEKNTRMSYLSLDNMKAMGFKRLGVNVKISDKASIYDADKIEIGDHSRIDDFCILSGNISLGSYNHITRDIFKSCVFLVT